MISGNSDSNCGQYYIILCYNIYGKNKNECLTMSKFKDKFHLTPEQSLFLAKKKWDENAYCGMKMEKTEQ